MLLILMPCKASLQVLWACQCAALSSVSGKSPFAKRRVAPLQEYYTFIENGESDYVNKLGPFAWLGMAVVLAETLIVVKFGRACGTFARPFPLHVKAAWGAALGLGAAVLAVWSARDYLARRRPPARVKAA